MNRAILWGNIGRDPELKMSAGGTAVLKSRDNDHTLTRLAPSRVAC